MTGPRAPTDPASPEALAILQRLWEAGFAAYAVGGGVRDTLLGRPAHDHDLTTDARPVEVLDLFPGSHPEGRFGTVAIGGVQVTTFRRDHQYGDHRRPDSVTFTTDIAEDLARRDFTVNAIAWGRAGDRPGPADEPALIDPTGGLADLDAGRLRAVGDADARFAEDALRLLRAARFAATLGFGIEPGTLDAMRNRAADARWLSGERVGAELRRMLADARPSDSLRILGETGILIVVLPELAAQRGVPQAKVAGGDLWDHTLGAADAAVTLDGSSETLVMAALLHDVGKPATFSDGHFLGHDQVGAELARSLLRRIRHPADDTDRIATLVREHMFHYRSEWSDAAVRRFLRRIGPGVVDDLIRLRQADNLGSGLPADAGGLPELRARIEQQRAARAPLTLGELAVDGTDLMAELGRRPGPWLGALLERLLESVVNDPARNQRAVLLADAREWNDGAR